MDTNKRITAGRIADRLLAVLALAAFAAALLPATATADDFGTPSIYYTKMPRFHSVIMNKQISIAVKYKRVAGYLHQLNIYQNGQRVLQTTDDLGNVLHDSPYFSLYADKTGSYWGWFGPITLAHMGVIPAKEEIQNLYLEMCYMSFVAAPVCKKSDAYEVVVRQDYPFISGDWETRLSAGPRDRNRAYNLNVSKHVGGYYTNWSIYAARNYFPKDIAVENLTHIYHAFVGICSDNYNQRAKDIEADNKAKKWPGTPFSSLKTGCDKRGAKEFEIAFSDVAADIEQAGMDSTESRDLCPGSAPYCAWPNEREPFKGIYAEYYRMKKGLEARGKSIKIMLSIGGYTLSDPFFELAKTSTGRKTFVDSVTRFLTEYDVFDGVDIDWEFPGDPDNPVANATEDKANFTALMELLRTKLDGMKKITGKKYELTIAVGPSVKNHVAKLDMASLSKYVNRVNLMTYDYYGTWNNTFGHQTALGKCSLNGGSYLQPNADSYATATVTGARWGTTDSSFINIQIDHNVPQNISDSKLNIGVAAYGRAWKEVETGTSSYPVNGSSAVPVETGYVDGSNPPSYDFKHYLWGLGVVSYSGIERFITGSERYSDSGGTMKAAFGGSTPQARFDTTCSKRTDYLWIQPTSSGKGAFVTYDGPYAVKDKAAYVKDTDIGGIFIWELAGDTGTLLNFIHGGLGSTSAN